MLKKLFQEWRSVDLMTSALDEMGQMADLGAEMVSAAIPRADRGYADSVRRSEKGRKNSTGCRSRSAGRSVRHLHINPRQDVLACVTLLHVVIYVERIGDYAKNMHEQAQILNGAPFERVAESEKAPGGLPPGDGGPVAPRGRRWRRRTSTTRAASSKPTAAISARVEQDHSLADEPGAPGGIVRDARGDVRPVPQAGSAAT